MFFSILVFFVIANAATSTSRSPTTANVYIVTDPRIWTSGRSVLFGEARQFNWESVSFSINVKNATYVTMKMEAKGKANGYFLVSVNGKQQEKLIYVRNTGFGSPTYLVASLKPDPSRAFDSIEVVNVLEPAMTECTTPESFFSFYSFTTDGVAVRATPYTRHMLVVGDSISAGYGSRGEVNVTGPCKATPLTSGNPFTYDYFLAEHFKANLQVIAWSGRGMYKNCCGLTGSTMPQYFLQSLAGDPLSRWNFTNEVVDFGTSISLFVVFFCLFLCLNFAAVEFLVKYVSH